MIRRRPAQLLYTGAALLVSTLACCAQQRPSDHSFVPSVSSAHAPLVFAYFYYWYDLPSGPHSTALAHRPAEPDASYRNVGWFRKQLLDMEEAGIDVALAAYWGSAEPSSDVGLTNMAQAAQELRAAGHRTPRIGMFFDTGLTAGWSSQQRDLTQRANRQRMYELIRSFYSILPRDQWALVDGRPVLWLWANYFGMSFDHSLFDDLNDSFKQDFDTNLFVVGETSWRHAVQRDFMGVARQTDEAIALDDFYEWGSALTGLRTWGGIAQVGPGYDERLLNGPGRQGRVTDREDGRFYERNLEAALASGRRFLAIETWNEFHEASEIADSAELGRQYITITRAYTDRFKAKFAAEGDPSAVPITAQPTPADVATAIAD